MKWFVAIAIFWLLVVAAIFALNAKPLQLPLMIDAQSPGVWPRYAKATPPIELPPTPDVICIRAFIPKAMRPETRAPLESET